MSTYAATEAALLTLCRAYNGGATFTTENTRRGEWTIFDAPYDASLVIWQGDDSRYGDTAAQGRGAMGKQQETHSIVIELYYRRLQGQGGETSAYTALVTLRDALLAWIGRYPRLNDTPNVKRAEVVRVRPPALAGATPTNAATHWMSEVFVTVFCETALDIVEGIR